MRVAASFLYERAPFLTDGARAYRKLLREALETISQDLR
jgi:hypothetical protein